MAIYDTGPIVNIDGTGQIAQQMFIRVENTGTENLPANVLIEVYRIPEPNAEGYSQQIIYAQSLVGLTEFGSASNGAGPVFVLPVTLNSPLIPVYGVRITTFPDPGGGSQITATIFTENAQGETVAVQRVLPGEFGTPTVTLINPALQAVNEAQTPAEMRTAIEDPALGLDLTAYNPLSDTQKNQVAEIILNNRPPIGFTSVESVQIALNNAVDQVTVDPNNIYVEAGATDGDGSQANPFGTIEEGVTAVNPGGTVHILEGTYNIENQLVIDKSLTLQGEGDVIPQIVFSPTNTLDGLVIQADNVTVDNLHLISNRALTGSNAVFSVPLRTLDNLYENITISSNIIEGTVRSGYIFAENITIEDNEFIHNAVNTQALRFQMVDGTTNVLNNTFQGNSTSVGAVIFEPNLVSYTVSGTINVSGNTMESFNQFVNFFAILDGPTSLFIEDNMIDHQTNSGSSIILTTRVDYTLVEELLIQNNEFTNLDPQRLAVYFAGGGGGNNIPADDQIKVYSNIFNFPNGYGQRPGDIVDPIFPVGYNATAATFGMTLDKFDLQGNTNV
ncbi:hypothetical protein [Mesobacillus maritimus]|uniref:hypothetical protein n=1 Tax=Mesobacillus maritimus TaxID=1643336 RepID=UPI00384B4522